MSGSGRYIALDACCGNGVEWTDERPTRTVFSDLLFGLPNQSVQMDFTQLAFKGATFDRIFWDPPHLIRNDVKHFNPSYLHFGNWKNRAQWENALDSVNTEFHRVARPGGFLFVKIIDGADRRVTKAEDLDRLTLWEQVDLNVRRSKVGWSSCMTLNVTYRRRDMRES